MLDRMNMIEVNVSRLRELFDHNPATGALIWRPRPGTARNDRAGKPAGHAKKDGYVIVSVDGALYLKHRICWALFYGEWPQSYIDHIDGNPRNNAIANLRLASPSQNIQNTKHYRSNKTGVKGVYLHKHGKYEAFISKDKRRLYLGLFNDLASATAARAKAETELFTHRRNNA